MLMSAVERFATWPVAALLFIVFVFCNQGFEWRSNILAYNMRFLDMRYWYTPEDAYRLLSELGSKGRRIYAATELTLDLLFPFVYGSLLAILMVHLQENSRCALLPLTAALADWAENITIVYLISNYEERPSPVAWLGAVCTATKWTLLLISTMVILIGAATEIMYPVQP